MVIHIVNLSGAQACLNNPSVTQKGQVTINSGRQVIVPNARFNCNGKITNVAASMKDLSGGTNYPIFEVWYPYIYSGSYMKIGKVHFSVGSLKGAGQGSHYYAIISLNSSSQIEFQSGDVIGYYQPSNTRQIWSIQTDEYTSYSYVYTGPYALDLLHIYSDGMSIDNYQPLIKVMYGKVIIVCMTVIIYSYGKLHYFMCYYYNIILLHLKL